MLYALYAEQSGAKMLTAGILPSILMTILFMITVGILARKRNWPFYKGTTDRRAKMKIFLRAIPGFCVPIFLLVGLYSGLFAASELAALCSAFALFVSAVFYRQVHVRTFIDAAKESISNITAMFFILAAANVFSQSLAAPASPTPSAISSSASTWAGSASC